MSADSSGSPRISIPPRLIIGIIIAIFSLITYFANTSYNPVTEQKQHVAISPSQEIALGLESAPQMAQQYGGEASDAPGTSEVDEIGNNLVSKSVAGKTPYKFKFHLLADPKTVNAFALPGGQVFITEGLLKKLSTRGEVACVLAHECGHVVARHSAQHIAKANLTNGLTGAAAIASYDPNDPNSRNTAAIAAVVGELVNLKFSRADESEADKIGVKLAADAGYDPHSMIEVMKILEKVAQSRTPEFFSTHPNPENRIEHIKAAIAEDFPNGVPSGLEK